MGRHERAPRLDVEREIVQAGGALRVAHRAHEVGRRGSDGLVARVLDAEASTRVDELERAAAPGRPQGRAPARRARAPPRCTAPRRELRADVGRHPHQAEVRRALDELHRTRHVVARDAELRLVVPGRDVRVGRALRDRRPGSPGC